MTQVFSVDSNNDLFIKENGTLAINTQLQAVLQACEHVAKSQLFEMVLDQERGVPNFETIWNGSPNIAQFEAFLRRNILTVPDVIEIVSLETNVQNNVLRYVAEIRTTFGTGVLNGV